MAHGRHQTGILPGRGDPAADRGGAHPASPKPAADEPGAAGEPRPPPRRRRRRACARASCPARISPSPTKLEQLALHEFDLTDGAVLETGCVYIVPLLESLALPADIAASANPKSSTGRLDIFTRVITDQARAFDQMPAGYHGPLYPRGQPAHLSDPRAHGLAAVADPLPPRQRGARRRGARRPAPARDAGERQRRASSTAWRSRSTCDGDARRPRRLPRQAPHRRHRRRPRRRLRRRRISGSRSAAAQRPEIVLDPAQFYILVSGEAVHVPPDYAAEMVPFDPLVGEFRVHYAGFFDPGFGHGPAGGTAAAPCWKCAATKCRSSWSTARRRPARLRADGGAARQPLRHARSAPTTRRRA